jgi:hypothetical protein
MHIHIGSSRSSLSDYALSLTWVIYVVDDEHDQRSPIDHNLPESPRNAISVDDSDKTYGIAVNCTGASLRAPNVVSDLYIYLCVPAQRGLLGAQSVGKKNL